jgi:hypothetical protein
VELRGKSSVRVGWCGSWLKNALNLKKSVFSTNLGGKDFLTSRYIFSKVNIKKEELNGNAKFTPEVFRISIAYGYDVYHIGGVCQ